MRTKTICTLLMLCACLSVMAQTPELDTKLVLAQDDMRLKNYRAAANSLHWLMTNAPEHSKSIYIMAYKAYEKVAQASTDKAEKAVLLDSMMLSYRLKEAQFGLTDLEKNNIAFRYYKYFRKDASKHPEAISAYQEIYKSPETVINNNLVSYMSIVRAYQAKTKIYDVKELMAIHKQVTDVIDSKRAAGENETKLSKYTDAVDQIFFQTVKPVLNCKAIEELATTGGDHDIEYTKMIFAWSLEFGCSGTDFFVDIVKKMANNPATANAGILKLLAQKAVEAGNHEEALEWYTKSLPLMESDEKRAGIYMDMAKVHLLEKDKSKARAAAFKAADLDAGEAARALSFVANLYMASFEECAEKYSQIDDRAIFIAAYDLFEKAGDSAGMQAAREQFPTKAQAFTATYDEGDVIDVGCWVNVKVKLRTRPSN